MIIPYIGEILWWHNCRWFTHQIDDISPLDPLLDMWQRLHRVLRKAIKSKLFISGDFFKLILCISCWADWFLTYFKRRDWYLNPTCMRKITVKLADVSTGMRPRRRYPICQPWPWLFVAQNSYVIFMSVSGQYGNSNTHPKLVVMKKSAREGDEETGEYYSCLVPKSQ